MQKGNSMGKELDRIELIRLMEKELKYARFVHTMAVAFTATGLAACYGTDIRKAEIAGILHDCAKYYSADKMENLCKKEGIRISDIEKGNTALLHSKAGTVLARTKYGVSDPEILDAIRFHTTGRPGMTLLEKIIFISDYIEPGRNSAPRLDEIRKMAFADIDEALRMILSDTLRYLNGSGKAVDPMTQKTYDYYLREDSASDLS